MKPIRSGEVTIATESFGDPADPPVVLVMGATASMLGWPEPFCMALSHRDRFVIRYDHRDTGQSTTVAPGAADYAVEDMVADLFAVLDGYGLAAAHLVGMSLGGYIAQMAALTDPDRVLSLTLLASEPLGWDGEPLPHIAPAFLDHFAGFATLDWSNRDAVAAFLLEIDRLSAGSAYPFDGAAASERIGAVIDRAGNLPAMFNHGTVATREDWTGRFRDIRQPVLVVHGAEDPILPPDNGRALAEGIAIARLLLMPGLGHELPAQVLPSLVELIATHTRR
ncbi:alpha/beta fold hydrolase [Pseudooceanicola sp. LIPI14-2-Ac024]|uniref:alpha/beta fold hydrolase n=1 Tax=Pseudooceanicola sp. LIPI14-2-Ac024 TaxID=3344875 RepID=UPI0035D1255F